MSIARHDNIAMTHRGFSRRSFLHTVSAASLAAGSLGIRDVATLHAEELKRQHKSMILLWMAGGPSQLETFDPKPGTENGGPTEAISTAVDGIQIAKGWERTARQMKEITVLRSLTNKEGQHDRATYQLHTGYIPSGSVKHPALGSNLAKELMSEALELPSVVTIGGGRFANIGAGFLGVDFEPFQVNNPGGLPDNVGVASTKPRYERRLGLLGRLDEEFAQRGGETVVENHRRIYDKASKLVLSTETEAFNLEQESAATRDAYGRTAFGNGCLLARRLAERGVPFIEVRVNGWDTHQDNFEAIDRLAGEVDPGMGALIGDLKDRGLLDSTLVVWMGEFGRTPRVNPRGGRDHYPRVFNALLAGGGVRGGQVIGNSTADGTAVADAPVTVPDLFVSICQSLGVDAAKERMSPLGRPMKIVDGGTAIPGLFG
ncbi:MAG: DUF1501 domain-containing protein [Planctomycetaceae bacterium]|nr:DUF1501 domain-containing protein [Planctomycetaceae bacterium]